MYLLCKHKIYDVFKYHSPMTVTATGVTTNRKYVTATVAKSENGRLFKIYALQTLHIWQ